MTLVLPGVWHALPSHMFLLVAATVQVGGARGVVRTVSLRRLQCGVRTLPALHAIPLLSVSLLSLVQINVS